MREGWEQSELSSIAEVVMGQSPPGTSYNSVGSGIPFIQGSAEFGAIHPSPAKWCTDPRKIAEPGDVLFSVRAPVGDLNVANQRIAIGRGLSIIRGTDGKASTSFLALALSFGASEIAKRSSTGMFTSITGAQLKSLPIALPPLGEQRRIVDLMDSVDAAISAAQAAVDAAVELRDQVLGHELRTPGAGWEQTTLGKIAHRTIGRTPPRKESKYWTDDIQMPFCTIKSMQDRANMSFSEGVTEEATSDKVAKLAPEGALLLSFKLSIGRVRFAPRDVYFNEAIAWIRPIESTAKKEFVALALENVDWDSLGSRAVKGKTLNSQSLDSVPIPLPPLHEQERMVETMNTLDETVEASRASLDRLRDLRPSMLSVLLSGEHEIPNSYDQFLELSDDERAG